LFKIELELKSNGRRPVQKAEVTVAGPNEERQGVDRSDRLETLQDRTRWKLLFHS
jgi:hypothetical protein